MASLYDGLLTRLLTVTSRPAALLIGVPPAEYVGSMAPMSHVERTFDEVSQALDSIAIAAVVAGGSAALAGIACAVIGTVAGSDGLVVAGGWVLGLVIMFGALLVIVRVRQALGRSRYSAESHLPLASVAPAAPRPWDALVLAMAYALGVWLALRL